MTPTLSHIEATIIGLTKQGGNEYEIFHAVYEYLDKAAPEKDINWVREVMNKVDKPVKKLIGSIYE